MNLDERRSRGFDFDKRKKYDSAKKIRDFKIDLKIISTTFYEYIFCQYSFAKKIQTQSVSRDKLLKTLLYEKAHYKMLLKLTLGDSVNFFLLVFPNLTVKLECLYCKKTVVSAMK